MKFRFTMGRAEARVKTMTKEGFTQIEFHELPSTMTKAEAFQTSIAQELAVKHNLTIPTAEEAEAAEAA